MTKLVAIVACLLSTVIKSQYISVNRKLVSNAVSCDNNKTALVEHFFNIIFTEFHQAPPVCVCVQMCIDQPTYCYPNGCLKKADRKNVNNDRSLNQPYQETQIENNRPVMFLVDKYDPKTQYLSEKYMEKNLVPKDKTLIKDLHLDSFDKRYKMFYNNRKVPKLDFRYDLRKQVNNMKSNIYKVEAIDVTKTRWPLNKHINGNTQKYYYEKKFGDKFGERQRNKILAHSDFGTKPFYSTKYFKRDIKKKNDDDGMNMNTLYVIEKQDSNANNNNFSLESLINNLIESNVEVTNKTEFDLNVELNNPIHYDKNVDLLNSTEVILKNNTIELRNETIDANVSNYTNELEESKYVNNTNVFREKNYKNKFSDMIASLSKQIEKQNNTSLEIMKQFIGMNIKTKTDPNISIESYKIIHNYTSTESAFKKMITNKTFDESLDKNVKSR
ncbi:uncharacterized protein LOC113523081 [Galleria mellonella]|uniref:Uncharacterized protein LOC113523081 n=1 Tax=Galleria mellonella TaxID=7137 RepID=A0ABM3MRI2_GALME|nr:uncharacterized protein LOC113523081 [Galleria mellonella]